MRSGAFSRFALMWLAASAMLVGQTVRDLKVEKTETSTGMAKSYALVVGISQYRNLPAKAQLKFAHRDAEEFARLLRSESGGGLSSTTMRVLMDGQATLSAIRGALHTWLPQAAGANDVVYIFFAGHGVVAEQGEAYFVAHDSDPQNLHSTGLSFREVNETLSTRLKSSLVIVLADACHAGTIGWTDNSAISGAAQTALENMGSRDKSFLKLLASRPSEQSFESDRWDGGHGIFTHALLTGLRGEAEQDRDGVVRVSELIEHVSRLVPKETQSQQNPRVAGNFEPRLPLAVLKGEAARPKAAGPDLSIDVVGPAGTGVYVDRSYRGKIRATGDLRLNEVSPGEHKLEVEFPDGRTFEQTVSFAAERTKVDLDRLPGFALMRLESAIRRKEVLQPGGAWDYYSSQQFLPEHKMLAQSMMASALEDIGQECVNDYVQSTSTDLKAPLLLAAVEAYTRLQHLRSGDHALQAKRHFCEGRVLIAASRFEDGVKALEASLRIDPNFACAHNALGVALARLHRQREARQAFDTAAKLTPEWFLPPLEIAQQYVGAGQAKNALPFLERAVRFNPQSPVARWTLMRVLRLIGKHDEFVAQAHEMLKRFPNYAPTYLELAAYHESRSDFARAAQSYNAYLALAPNFENSGNVRARADKIQSFANRPAPSLIK